MTDSREAFEKWHDKLFDTSARECREAYGYPNNTAIQARYQVWQARQPEIDALRAALEPKYTEAELVNMCVIHRGWDGFEGYNQTIRALIEMGVFTIKEV